MKGVSGKLRLGRILLFLFLVPILVIFGIRKWAMSPSDVSLDLPAIERVGEGMKMTVTPLKRLANHHVSFMVRRESYQYQELLDGDLTKTSLLVDEFDTPSVPNSWKETRRETGIVMGELVFPYSPTSSAVTLTFDDMEDVTFNWRLPKEKGVF